MIARRRLRENSRRGLVVAVAVFVLGGCTWPAFRFGPERTGFNPYERLVGPANVARLAPLWSVNTGTTGVGDPVVGDGRIVVPAGSRLLAFDTSGTLAWSKDFGTAGTNPFTATGATIAGNAVWAGDAGISGGLPVGSFTEYAASDGTQGFTENQAIPTGDPAATTDFVYFPFIAGGYRGWGAQSLHGGNSFVSTNDIVGVPTIGGGHVFAQGAGGVLEGGFDATGASCPAEPDTGLQICEPAWTATIGSSLSAIAYTSSTLYVGANDAKLYAFASNGCSSSTCNALWTGTANGGLISSPAVANGTVYIGSGDGKLYAFAAAGCGHTTCAPLWTMATGAAIVSSPAVANGVVYVGSDDGRLYAADAAGCGQPTCAPLFESAAGAAVRSSPAVALGRVYVGRIDGTFTAYDVP